MENYTIVMDQKTQYRKMFSQNPKKLFCSTEADSKIPAEIERTWNSQSNDFEKEQNLKSNSNNFKTYKATLIKS